MFLLDSSGSIGASNFENMKISTAIVAAVLAEAGARVGVVVFSGNATVEVPLQYWDNIDALGTLDANIINIDYTEGGTNTHIGINTATSILGNKGTRVILLLADGDSNDRQAAVEAADAAKEAGINIYAAGIGDSISEEELDLLASYPPEDYRVSIADFTRETLEVELQSLIASICLSKYAILLHKLYCTMYTHILPTAHTYHLSLHIVPEHFFIGKHPQEVLREGQVRSLQYDLPEDGLTITANVNGEANVYMSYTVRNPNYATADFITAGSGLLSYYVPANEDARVIVHTRLFVAIAAKKDNTTITANTTLGDHFIQIGMSNNSSVCNSNYVLQMIMDIPSGVYITKIFVTLH